MSLINIDALGKAYIVPSNIYIGDGGFIDFRYLCDNVNDFEEFYQANDVDLRRPGLLVYEKDTGQLKIWTDSKWKSIATSDAMDTFFEEMAEQYSKNGHTHQVKDIVDMPAIPDMSSLMTRKQTEDLINSIVQANDEPELTDEQINNINSIESIKESTDLNTAYINNSLGNLKLKILTSEEWEALENKDSDTIYFIEDDQTDDATFTNEQLEVINNLKDNAAADLQLSGTKLQLKNMSGEPIGTQITLPSTGGTVVPGSTSIDDSQSGTDTTYSSSKIESLVSDKIGDLQLKVYDNTVRLMKGTEEINRINLSVVPVFNSETGDLTYKITSQN